MVAENLVINDFSTHHFELVLQNLEIAQNSGFLVNFGNEYISLENLDTIQCSVSYLAMDSSIIVVSDINSCNVRGKRVQVLILVIFFSINYF